MAEAKAPQGQRTRWQQIARRIRVPLGFVFAAVFLLSARPSGRSLLFSLPLVLAGLWLRGYAAGYVRKNTEITCTGPYAYTRNPLYLGSSLIAFGFALASGRVWLLVLLAGLFAAIYIPTIRSEEIFLRSTFAGFDKYASRVPRFLPRLTPARFTPASPTPQNADANPSGRFSRESYRRHREYNASMGAAAIYVALLLRIALR